MLCGTAQTANPSTQFLFVINTNGTDFEVPFFASGGLGVVANRADLTLSDNIFYGSSGPGVNSLGAIIALKLPITLNSNQTNYVFESGWTYHVTASVTLYGATTIQSNSVIKYDVGTGIFIDGTNLICTTTLANPAVFTAKDDDSVGAIIPGSTGSPSGYYGYGLVIPGDNEFSLTLRNCKFYYLDAAILYSETASWQTSLLKLFNIQAYNCNVVASTGGVLVDFENCLFANDEIVWSGWDTIATAENMTVAHCDYLGDPNDGGGSSLYVTNCLTVAVSNYNDEDDDLDYETSDTVSLSDDSGVFTSSGADNYYLATSSPYRDVGTSAIDAALLSELETMTTLAPQDGGGADSLPLDLGYHYAR
jgi:hypothetical protein